MKQRLDQVLAARGLVASRSQAESYIKLGQVKVNGQVASKPHQQVGENDKIIVTAEQQYVSRAALKLASVTKTLGIDFTDKVVLDIGSSTGGFTQYALQHGAKKVIAVEVGTNQLHPSLRNEPRIELHEQTDIRNVRLQLTLSNKQQAKSKKDEPVPAFCVLLSTAPDIVLADLSFISLREVLPHIATLIKQTTVLVVMVKPQFEVGDQLKHKGVIKNDAMRRDILKNFETWTKQHFVILDKADSEISGAKGNRERFYLLNRVK